MIQFEIKAIVSDDINPFGDHTIYLFNKTENLLLPIKINETSANIILMAKDGAEEPRPNVHNTATRLIKALSGKVDRIILSGYENEVFYAYIRIKQGEKEIDVDSKPTDAFAIALTINAPIYARKEVVEKAGIKLTPEMFIN